MFHRIVLSRICVLMLTVPLTAELVLAEPLVEKVFFTTDLAGTGNSDLFMADPDGSNIVNLTPGSPQNEIRPSISPDGTRIAAGTGDGSSFLIYDLQSWQADYFAPSGGPGVPANTAPMWRTNDELLYNTIAGVETWACNPEGGNAHLYIDYGAAGWPGPPGYALMRSPDGTRLAGQAQDGYWAPTQDPFWFGNSAVPDSGTLDWIYEHPGNNRQDNFLDFFPNGDVLLRHHMQGYPANPQYTALARTTPGSGVLEYLTETDGFAGMGTVSPDGNEILYTTWQASAYLGPVQVWRMDVLGGSAIPFLPGEYSGFNADWGMVVPEPGTLSLLALGAVIALRRRR
jgi:hypothetical protein